MTTKSRISTMMPILFIFLCTFIITQSVTDHCSTTKPQETIGLLADESLTLTLGDYIRGHGLTF